MAAEISIAISMTAPEEARKMPDRKMDVRSRCGYPEYSSVSANGFTAPCTLKRLPNSRDRAHVNAAPVTAPRNAVKPFFV